jgi:hypothetical protein
LRIEVSLDMGLHRRTNILGDEAVVSRAELELA